jgi:nicotinamide-nucleotide amidase
MDILAHELAGVIRERTSTDLRSSTDLRLFLAESCTGGLISATLTRVPGVSRFVVGGVVAVSHRRQ